MTIQCVDCLSEFEPTAEDFRSAREYEARAVQEQGVKAAASVTERLERFGPEICPACMPDHLRRREA